MAELQIVAPAGSASAEMTNHLIAVAERQDKSAFSELFAYYAPRIKYYLMAKGSSASSAEDLSQEAMVSVWRQANRYDSSKAAASTWIFTVARNLRIDAFRKENRPSFNPEDPAFIPEPETAPDTALSLSENQALIREVITNLSSEQAEVIRLAFYQDKSHSEIAAELNLPLGTVKSRLRLAMRKLRNTIKVVH
ncbi:MAG: sigma-70 family RNA polymerase sigma factor [Rhodospirillaceae bacterium]|nr:sigma-70 family RNA polymerase sigma factor [Rhodospirillaceae bacterium]